MVELIISILNIIIMMTVIILMILNLEWELEEQQSAYLDAIIWTLLGTGLIVNIIFFIRILGY